MLEVQEMESFITGFHYDGNTKFELMDTSSHLLPLCYVNYDIDLNNHLSPPYNIAEVEGLSVHITDLYRLSRNNNCGSTC